MTIRPAVALDAVRHRHHARAHGRHLRPIVERVDRAHQRTAEGRAGRGKRAVGIDVERGAVGGQSSQQRGCHRAGEVAAERGGAEQQDLRLVGVDDVGQRLSVGFIAIVGEQVIGDDVSEVGAVTEGLSRGMPRRLAFGPDHHRGKIDLELVGKLASGAQQFPRHGMNLAAFLLHKHPDVLVGLEMLRQLLLGRRSACGGRCFGGFAHVAPSSQNPRASATSSASSLGCRLKISSISASAGDRLPKSISAAFSARGGRSEHALDDGRRTPQPAFRDVFDARHPARSI